MSALAIKIFAVIFMFVDHIGFALGTDGFAGFEGGYVFCRAVGRLALPLFAFLIANGYKYTRDVKKYALRLLAFALISEAPFDLFIKGKFDFIDYSGRMPNPSFDNIFFTLFLGLAAISAVEFYKKKGIKHRKLLSVLTCFALATFAGFISADYGAVGVAWVVMFGLYLNGDPKNKPFLYVSTLVLGCWRIIARVVLVIVYRLTMVNIGKIPGLAYFFAGKVSFMMFIQPIAILALLFIRYYNGKSGMPENKTAKTVIKYAFYAFYPVHLLLLYLFV